MSSRPLRQSLIRVAAVASAEKSPSLNIFVSAGCCIVTGVSVKDTALTESRAELSKQSRNSARIQPVSPCFGCFCDAAARLTWRRQRGGPPWGRGGSRSRAGTARRWAAPPRACSRSRATRRTAPWRARGSRCRARAGTRLHERKDTRLRNLEKSGAAVQGWLTPTVCFQSACSFSVLLGRSLSTDHFRSFIQTDVVLVVTWLAKTSLFRIGVA